MNRTFPATLCVLAVIGLAAGFAAPAQAFTIEDGGSSKGTAKNAIADENSPFYGPKRFDLDVKEQKDGVYKFGNSELRIGSQPSPEAEFRSGVDRMFSPLGRPPN